MTRVELQQLAQDRILDAKALLAAKRWSGAYYLAGYAVECGLKACVIVRLMKTDEFPEKKFSEQCWTHNLIQLISVAALSTTLAGDKAADPQLDENWDITKDWTEASRYLHKTKAEAQDLFEAITDKKHGVLPWIKLRW